jgi:hypothetical protein
MTYVTTTIDHLDWGDIADQLGTEGYALLPGLLASGQVETLVQMLPGLGNTSNLYPVSLASCDLGHGDMFYLGEQLPAPLHTWRPNLYHHLAPLANRWNEMLSIAYRYPARHDEFLQHNHEAGQAQPLSHLSRLSEAGYLALHQQDKDGYVFPMQVVALLSEPGQDFEGGEFVMIEQRPRMQSRPMVLPLTAGDAAIIGTAQRPIKGSKGHYRQPQARHQPRAPRHTAGRRTVVPRRSKSVPAGDGRSRT